MASVGVRELKEQTSQILRRVRENGETIDVTYRGRVVARVVPVEPARPDPEALASWLAEHEKLAEEVSKHWPVGVSAVDTVRDVRRDL